MMPLETVYNGYRFRSRLEARWAVFFDAMQWPYAYEHEGFTLKNGTRYLPDFWLPAIQTWLEIKPVEPSQDERRKAYDFASAGVPYYIFFGPPWAFGCFWVGEEQEWQIEEASFARCRRCSSGIYIIDDAEDHGRLFFPCESQCTSERYPIHAEDIEQAALHAKGSRFEHGESGAARGMALPSFRRPPPPTPVSPEYMVLMLLCHHTDMLTHAQKGLAPAHFHDADLRAIYAAMLERASRSAEQNLEALSSAVTTTRQRKLLVQIAMESPLTNAAEAVLLMHNCITKIQQRQGRARLEHVIGQLRTATSGSVEEQRLVEEYHRLQRETMP